MGLRVCSRDSRISGTRDHLCAGTLFSKIEWGQCGPCLLRAAVCNTPPVHYSSLQSTQDTVCPPPVSRRRERVPEPSYAGHPTLHKNASRESEPCKVTLPRSISHLQRLGAPHIAESGTDASSPSPAQSWPPPSRDPNRSAPDSPPHI
jgi:hypothetical protein